MLEQEVAVQAQKSERLARQAESNQKKAEDFQLQLGGVKKKLQLKENRAADDMNVASGKIHAEYVKIQQDKSELREERDLEKATMEKLRERLEKVGGKAELI